jgi:hypothetical protein
MLRCLTTAWKAIETTYELSHELVNFSSDETRIAVSTKDCGVGGPNRA